MKIKISIILIIIIFINAIFPKTLYAEDYTMPSAQDVSDTMAGKTDVLDNVKGGQANVNGIKIQLKHTPTMGGSTAKILVSILSIFPTTINAILTIVSFSASGNSNLTWITIEDIVFGKIKLFDIDYFKFTAPTSSGWLINLDPSSANDVIKAGVASWYYSIRNLSIVILLAVLIYIGIRMAMSTISSDKAKYKKMFTAWVTSFILVFVIHYIVVFALYISGKLVDIIAIAGNSTKVAFEAQVFVNSWMGMFTPGWGCVIYFVTYCVLTFFVVRFFFMYMKRIISVGFLILIAPLVTITYSIDKVGDGEAQAFKMWFKELMVNIFIQPIHALLYVIFMYTAGAIAVEAPVLAIVFMVALSRGEKTIKEVFGMRGNSSVSSMGETLKLGKK